MILRIQSQPERTIFLVLWCAFCFPSALGKSKKFQRRSYEICLAGVFHSAFRRVNRLHGGERIKKHIPRRPTMLLSPARGNQKADQVVNLVGFFSSLCETACVRAYAHQARESDESSGTARGGGAARE